MIESSYYNKLNQYYKKKAVKLRRSITWEAKFTRSKRIPFDALAPHQEEFLLQSERIYGLKLPDVGRMKKPFDGFAIYGAATFFIAIYFLPRATEIYEIPLRTFLNEKYTSKEKSLTRERASELASDLLEI